MTTINSHLCQRSRSYISMAHASWIGSLRVGLQILRINEEITSIDIKPIAVGLGCRWGVGGHSKAAGKAMGGWGAAAGVQSVSPGGGSACLGEVVNNTKVSKIARLWPIGAKYWNLWSSWAWKIFFWGTCHTCVMFHWTTPPEKMNTFPHCGLTLIVLNSVLIIWI